MIHAQLDGNFICFGFGDLTNIELVPTLVYLPNGWEEDLLWRKYENGTWSTDKFKPNDTSNSVTVNDRLSALESALLEMMLS